MATPVFACGAECGVVSPPWLHFLSTFGTTSFDTGTVRTGARSLRTNPTATSGYFNISLASSAVWVVRAYVRFATLPSANTAILNLGGRGVYFKQSDSKLYVGTSTSALGATGVTTAYTGAWYRIDFKATATTLDAQVNGTAVGGLTSGIATSTVLRVGPWDTCTADMFTDDILISHTAADYPLGAGFVKSYIPNADGTHNLVGGNNDFERTFTNVAITNATTDAYDLINERPLPTTEVDFINAVAPPTTDYVEWQYEDSTEADPPRAVEGLIIYHDAGGPGTNDFAITLREHAGSTSGDIFNGTGNVGAAITGKRAIFLTVPGTSDPWTTTKFNALRSRFIVADASPDVYLDAVMLEAEFPEVIASTDVPFHASRRTLQAVNRASTY